MKIKFRDYFLDSLSSYYSQDGFDIKSQEDWSYRLTPTFGSTSMTRGDFKSQENCFRQFMGKRLNITIEIAEGENETKSTE